MGIFWTLQRIEAWENAKRLGYLVGSEEYVEKSFKKAYLWMMEQMKMQLPNYNGEYPIWLWLKKPDMRSTGHFPSGTKCVRLTVELDERDVLVSDFDDWHFVLNNDFCADNEEEYDNYHAGKLAITKEESWNRIFNIHRLRDPYWYGEHERILQGVTGKIDLTKVKKVEHFVTRKSRY